MQIVYHKYGQLNSTNEKALQMVASGKAGEGMVLIADQQTQGRGAGQNLWESEPGKNLTFSIILEPVFMNPSRQFALTEMVSLALFDVVEKRLGCENLYVKWPNDLYYLDKKMAGILIQNRIKGDQLDFTVIGVGLNVNQKEFYSDAPNPGSMIHFSGKEESLPTLLEEILNGLDFYYEKLKTDIHSLKTIYLQRLYRIGEWAEYEDAAGRFTAKITGVDSFGRLLLTDRQGDLRVYGFKEIEYLT